ncbi:MAG: FHA domain-containing protein [Chloroflexota bacterium]
MNKTMGRIGMMFGSLAIIIGLFLLIFIYLFPSNSPGIISAIPGWVVLGLMYMGGVAFWWTRGLLYQKDWSPFMGASFFLHFGLYVSIVLWVLFTITRDSFLPAISTSTIAQQMVIFVLFLLMMIPTLVGFYIAVQSLSSPSLLSMFEGKYRQASPLVDVCDNVECRMVIKRGSVCERCSQIRAYLTLLDTEGQKMSSERQTLKFSGSQTKVMLNRNSGEPINGLPSIGFSAARQPQYKSISSPHARVRMDVNTNQFYLKDEGSSYGTYVNGHFVEKNQEVPIAHKAKVQLGNANFLFEYE